MVPVTYRKKRRREERRGRKEPTKANMPLCSKHSITLLINSPP